MKKRSKVIGVSALALAAFGILSAESCESDNPAPDSDSSYKYAGDVKIPVDEEAYTVTGEVSGQVNNLTRQVKPAEGTLSGTTYSNGYGSTTGSFTGPIEAGKGFVRLLVKSSDTVLAPVNELVILKTSDSKVTALLPGDIVTLKCRRQYENIAAVKDDQKFDEQKDGTWELDYCRLEIPVVQAK